MGNIFGSPVDETIAKNHDFISDMSKMKMERWIQLHHQMYEREVAMEISKSRELFYWLSAFYGTTAISLLAKYRKTKRPGTLAPLLPLTFIVGYYADMAYGSKIHRIRAEADMIMQHEADLLEWPCGLPSVSSIDQARQEDEENKKLHPSVPSL